MKLTRVQLSRRKGWRMPPNTLKVDRSTRWGNPFVIGERFSNLALWISLFGVMSRTEIDRWHADGGVLVRDAAHAVELFEHYARWRISAAGGAEWIAPLSGKNVADWCKLDAPCHGDVLLRLANQKVGEL